MSSKQSVTRVKWRASSYENSPCILRPIVLDKDGIPKDFDDSIKKVGERFKLGRGKEGVNQTSMSYVIPFN
jgi:hypothetical protein